MTAGALERAMDTALKRLRDAVVSWACAKHLARHDGSDTPAPLRRSVLRDLDRQLDNATRALVVARGRYLRLAAAWERRRP